MALTFADCTQPCEVKDLKNAAVIAVLRFIDQHGDAHGVRYIEARKAKNDSFEALVVEVDVDLPQRPDIPIQRTERIAVAFDKTNNCPSVLALRPDFPDALHQNFSPEGWPAFLCIDDRPWQEARLTWNPSNFIQRIRTWLAKAACGDLHDPIQPLEPLYYGDLTKIVFSADSISNPAVSSRQIATFVTDQPKVLLTRCAPEEFGDPVSNGRIVVLTVNPPLQEMRGMRKAPTTLERLAIELKEMGFDLFSLLTEKLKEWAPSIDENKGILTAKLVICVVAKVRNKRTGAIATDLKAFLSAEKSIGEIGVAIGVLYPGGQVAGKKSPAFVRNLTRDTSMSGGDVPLVTLDAILDFERSTAVAISGLGNFASTKVALVGAGSLGSQVAMFLAREGAARWLIIDNDTFLPHNLARHVLRRADIGWPKAEALSREIQRLLQEPSAAQAIVADVLASDPKISAEVSSALAESDVVLDCSASVAVSRHISDLDSPKGRRFSVFFNPTGTAVVLLAEPKSRSATLRDLESQYYQMVLDAPELRGHLAESQGGFRYTGSCRALTNRIPARSAAILSAIAAGGVLQAMQSDSGGISIWTLENSGEIKTFARLASRTHSLAIDGWTISSNLALEVELMKRRKVSLPNETGGVVLGSVDHDARRIHVVDLLDAPTDSVSSQEDFERGVHGLLGEIERRAEMVRHQVQYIGEWHSHPCGMPPVASGTDIMQLSYLAKHSHADGFPAVMIIVGEEAAAIYAGVRV